MGALAKIQAAGFILTLTGVDSFEVVSDLELLPKQRQFLKSYKAELINELKGGTAKPPAIPPMEVWQKSAITAWIVSLGGDQAEITEALLDVLAHCEADAECRLYFLRRATSLLPTKTVICHDCAHFRPHHAHGRGPGDCGAGVQPSGLCHWFNTQKHCPKFKQKPE